MASIRHSRRSDGTVAHMVLYRIDGRQSSTTFNVPEDALRFKRLVDDLGPAEALRVLDASAGIIDSGAATPFGEFALAHIERLTGVQERTRAEYRGMLAARLSPLAALPVAAVTADRIREWVNALDRDGASPKTIKNYHGFLSSVLADAARRGIIPRNPAAGTRLPRGLGTEMVFLTPEQFAVLLSVVPEHYQTLVTVLASAGPRWSEATALTPADITDGAIRINKAWKMSSGRFSIGPPKTRRSNRTVPIAPALEEQLRALADGRRRDALLFTSVRGGFVRHAWFYRSVWLPVVRLASGESARPEGAGPDVRVARVVQGIEPVPPDRALEVRPRIHDLRHTAASWMIAAGLDLMSVQYALGHESITTTADRYGHLLPERRAATSAAMGRMLARASAAPLP